MTKEQTRKWLEPALKKLQKYASAAGVPLETSFQKRPSNEILFRICYGTPPTIHQFLLSEHTHTKEIAIYMLWFAIELFVKTAFVKCRYFYPNEVFQTNFATIKVGNQYIYLSIYRTKGKISNFSDIAQVSCVLQVSVGYEDYPIWSHNHQIETNLADAVVIIWNFLKLAEATN